jgi:SAM-dependent methyltransferase
MLGRAGGAFSARAVEHVEALLPQLGVARAAFGLPWTSEPLRTEATPNLLERLGLGDRARVVASVPTPSATISVRDRGAYREMVASSAGSELVWTRAALSDPGRSGWPYVELLHVAAATARRRRRALFIGCGGAVALRQFASVCPGIALDPVEREPAVIELARAHYALGSIPRLRVHVADGIDFLRHAPAEGWDIGIVDAFDAVGVASPFARPPFYAALRRILRSGGTAACNFIASLERHGSLPRIVRAAGRELDDVRIVPVIVPGEDYAAEAQRNVVVVGRRR